MGKRFLKDVVKERKSSLKLSQVNDNGYFPVFGASGIVGYRDDFQIGDPAVAIIKDGAGIGRVSLLPKKSSVLGTMEAFVPNSDISNEYLYFYLTHLKLGQSFTGSTIPHIYFKNYKNSVFPDESFDNQMKKASYLISISNEISKKKNQIDNLDFLVKSLFVEMFGDPDLSSQKKEWSLVTSFSRIVTGTTPSTSDPDNWNGNILWVTPAEIKKDEFFMYDTERKITEKGKTSKSLSLMPIGTVILSTRAPIGKVAIVGKEMTCNQGFKNFICNKNVDPVYLYFLLKFNSEYLNSIGSGTTFKEISKSKIESLKMPIPPIKLQNEFATFVKLIDKSKFVCHSRYFLWLCLTLESSTMAYSSVVSIFECPKRRWTCSIGIPLSIAFVANVRRNL